MSSVRSVVVGALVACGLGAVAYAGDESVSATLEPTLNTVEVRIGAVLASNSGNEFDARLASLHHRFDRLFPYSSYRLMKEVHRQVPWGGKVDFDIPGGRYVVVIPKEYKNNRVSMKVMVIEGSRPIVDTAVSFPNHATFLVGGPREHEGVLILSIGASTVP